MPNTSRITSHFPNATALNVAYDILCQAHAAFVVETAALAIVYYPDGVNVDQRRAIFAATKGA